VEARARNPVGPFGRPEPNEPGEDVMAGKNKESAGQSPLAGTASDAARLPSTKVKKKKQKKTSRGK
jgi:hypothetical protein